MSECYRKKIWGRRLMESWFSVRCLEKVESGEKNLRVERKWELVIPEFEKKKYEVRGWWIVESHLDGKKKILWVVYEREL